MKDTGIEKSGGHLKPKHDADCADFLVAYHGHLAPQNPLPIHGFSPQNEPGKKKWESCVWKGDRFRGFLKVLRPKLNPAVAGEASFLAQLPAQAVVTYRGQAR